MKRCIPILLALVFIVVLAGCGTPETPTEPATTTTTPVATVPTTPTAPALPTDPTTSSTEPIPEPGTATTTDPVTFTDLPTVPTTKKAPAVKPVTTTKRPTTTTKKATTTTKPATTTKKPTTTTKRITTTKKPATTTKPPMTADLALKLFNDATKKVVDGKAGYKKSRTTAVTKLDFGLLGNMQIVKDAVYGFLGVGTVTDSAAKGTASNLLKTSTLSSSDVSSVTWQANGGGWIVTVNVKEGSTRWLNGSDRAPMDNGPLCFGADDSDKYDHKTARNIYTAINNAEGASTTGIGEKASSIKFVAAIDSAKRLTNLTASFNMHVDIDNVKYSIATLNNKSGDGTVSVTYSDFVY